MKSAGIVSSLGLVGFGAAALGYFVTGIVEKKDLPSLFLALAFALLAVGMMIRMEVEAGGKEKGKWVSPLGAGAAALVYAWMAITGDRLYLLAAIGFAMVSLASAFTVPLTIASALVLCIFFVYTSHQEMSRPLLFVSQATLAVYFGVTAFTPIARFVYIKALRLL